MKNNVDEERLFRILLEQGLIDEQQKAAYFTYQEEHENRTGERAPVARVLQKLDILSADQITSIMKAIETTPPVVSSNFSRSTAQTIENALGEKPKRIGPSRLFPAVSKGFVDEENESEMASTPVRSKPNILEKLSAGLDTTREKPSLDKPSILSISPKVSIPDDIIHALEEGKSQEQEVSAATYKESENIQDTPAQDSHVKETSPEKSILLAYTLLIIGGWAGAHRFYLRQYRTAFLYLFTLGFLGLGIVVDVFVLPLLLQNYRQMSKDGNLPSIWQKLQEYQNIQNNIAEPDWTFTETSFEKMGAGIKMLLNIVHLIIAPILLSVISILFWQPLICVAMLIWLFFFLGNLCFTKIPSHTSGYQHIPFFVLISQRIAQFTGFYFAHKPYSVLTYILYPIWLPLAVMFGEKRRQEVASHLWLLIPSIGLLGFGIWDIACYFNFEHSSKIVHLILLQGAIWLGSILLVLSLGMPIFVSLASFRIQRKETVSKIFGIWNFIIFLTTLLFICISPNFLHWESYSYQTELRLVTVKYDVEKDTIHPQIKMVFQNVLNNFKENEVKNGLCPLATKNFQMMMIGYFPGTKSKVFHIHSIQDSKSIVLYMGLTPILFYSGENKSMEEFSHAFAEYAKRFIVCSKTEEYRRYLDIAIETALQKME